MAQTTLPAFNLNEESQSDLKEQEERMKSNEINQACQQRDTDWLIKLADSSGGLLEDQLRRVACTVTRPV